MIVREFYMTRKDGVNLYKTYSTDKFFIKKIGTEEIYAEAIDVETAPYRYEETETKIDGEEELETEDVLEMIGDII